MIQVEQARLRFREEMDRCFERATERATVTRALQLGTGVVELRFANSAIHDALAQSLWLDGGSGALSPPAATIAVWDSESTGVLPPSPPWAPSDLGPVGIVLPFEGSRSRAAFNIDSQTLSFADVPADDGMEDIAAFAGCQNGAKVVPHAPPVALRCHLWTRSLRSLRGYERAAPLRTLLAWLAEARGLCLAHAGCVANGEQGVLLVGNGGSGKSTCALSCVGSGLDFVADDYCLVAQRPGGACAQAVFANAKLDRAHLERYLPRLASRTTHPDSHKVIIHPPRRSRGQTPVTLRAIVTPSVARGGEAKLERCTAGAALQALAPSSLFQTPGLGANSFRLLADVVRTLPCYSLRIGVDPTHIPGALWPLFAGDMP